MTIQTKNMLNSQRDTFLGHPLSKRQKNQSWNNAFSQEILGLKIYAPRKFRLLCSPGQRVIVLWVWDGYWVGEMESLYLEFYTGVLCKAGPELTPAICVKRFYIFLLYWHIFCFKDLRGFHLSNCKKRKSLSFTSWRKFETGFTNDPSTLN